MGSDSNAWIELYDDLRSKIKAGELRAEAKIDKTTISKNASDIDLLRAIDRLVDEGVLVRTSAHDVIVSTVRARSSRSASFQKDYETQSRLPTIKTLSLELKLIDDTPDFIKKTIRETNCSMLVHHHHLQSVDGVPHAIADSYVPYELVSSRWTDIKAGRYDIFDILLELGHEVTKKQETLYVDAPTLAERNHLGILSMPGLQVVRLDCVVWAKEQIVEICLLCDRSDLYEFNYVMRV